MTLADPGSIRADPYVVPYKVKAYELTCFLWLYYFFPFFSSGFRGPAHEPHQLATQFFHANDALR